MKEQLKKADLFGLVIIASALISYFIRAVWTNYQTGAVVIGGALILISLALKAGDIRAGLGRRSTKFGINSVTSVALLLGILAFVNYLGAQHPKRIDMTTEHLHSLADQSVQVAGQVKEDLKIKAFYPGGDDAQAREVLELYSNQNSQIAFEFIDPDKQPQLAQQYQVTTYGQFTNPMTGQTLRFGTLILELGDRTERIEKQEAVSEEDVTNALMKIVKGEKKTIYFTEGHGEKAIESGDRTGYQSAAKELEKAGYTVKPLNLVREGKVPDGTSVVVMAGPVTEPFPQETDMLDAYLNAGGSVLLLLDPPPAASLKDFTKKWSVEVGDNRVVDASGLGRLFGAGPEVPLVSNYGPHKITEKFNGVMTFFPLARSISPAKPPAEGVSAQPLLETTERSWGESDMKSSEVGFDEKVDLKGPVSIATVVNKDLEGKKSRLIVFGDSDFAMNAYFGAQGNGNLFTNVLRWLAQDESFISISAKNPSDRPLTMTESEGRLVSIVVVFLFPGAILATGAFVWARRRK